MLESFILKIRPHIVRYSASPENAMVVERGRENCGTQSEAVVISKRDRNIH